MKLQKLRIHHLPGIADGRGYEVEFGDGVTIVSGPNAIGKSSLIRAWRHLLATEDVTAVHVTAELRDRSGNIWQAERLGRKTEWIGPDGASVRPPLPPADLLHHWLLRMEDLTAFDQGDPAFQRHVYREMSGGIDLAAVRKELEQQVRLRRNAARPMIEALDDTRAIQREYHEFYGRYKRDRQALAERQPELDKQAKRLHDVERALELLPLIAERDAKRSLLSGYPESLENIPPDLEHRIERASQQCQELERRAHERQAQIRERERELDQLGISPLPEDATIAELQARLAALLEQAHQHETAQEHRERAAARLQQALQEIGQQKIDGLPDITPEQEAQLRQASRALEQQRAIVSELEQQVRHLEQRCGDTPDVDPGRLIRAIVALQEWLQRQPEVPAAVPRWLPWATAGTAMLAAALAFVQETAAAVAAGLATLFALAGAMRDKRPDRADPPEVDWRALGCEPISEWSAATVTRRLEELLRLQERLATGRASREELEKRRLELQDAQRRMDEARQKLRECTATLGLDDQACQLIIEQGSASWLGSVVQARQAAQHLAEAQAGLETSKTAISDTIQALRSLLERWPDLRVEDDAMRIRATVEAFIDRARRAANATRELNQLRDGLAELERDLAKATSELEELWATVDAEPGDLATLRERLEARQQRLDLLRELQTLEARIETITDQLNAAQDLLELARLQERDRLQQLRDQCEDAQQQSSDVRQQLAELDAKFQQTGTEQRLKTAEAELARCRSELQRQLETVLKARIELHLLDAIATAHEQEHTPELLATARTWFEQFTRGNFTLQLDHEGELITRDQRGHAVPPASLSTGTGMQLLLAIRLAWIEELEHQNGIESSPLFLDEALTVADEERFAVIARTLEETAETSGRQVIYLCARQHEASLWAHGTGHRPTCIDLAAVRRMQRSSTFHLDADALEQPDLPSPEGRDPAEWAQEIGVGPIDPMQDSADHVHIFYLLSDRLDLVHRFAGHGGITTCGQLRRLLRARGADDPELSAVDLPARLKVLDTWFDAAHQGRGVRVDPDALAAAGIFTPTYIEDAMNLLLETGGDGAALLAAVEDRESHHFPRMRNRDDVIAKLQEWLAAQGALSNEPRLDAAARYDYVLEHAGSELPVEALRALVRALEAGLTDSH